MAGAGALGAGLGAGIAAGAGAPPTSERAAFIMESRSASPAGALVGSGSITRLLEPGRGVENGAVGCGNGLAGAVEGCKVGSGIGLGAAAGAGALGTGLGAGIAAGAGLGVGVAAAGRGGTLDSAGALAAGAGAGDDESEAIGASPRTSWTVRTTSSIPT